MGISMEGMAIPMESIGMPRGHGSHGFAHGVRSYRYRSNYMGHGLIHSSEVSLCIVRVRVRVRVCVCVHVRVRVRGCG